MRIMYETKYTRSSYADEFKQWLANEHPQQDAGLSMLIEWKWFLTFTSKDVMTLNGARLAMTRFLGLYLQESKLDSVRCFWVAEPHNQGKKGYHVHALLDTKWAVPSSKKRALNVALIMDDIYQRAMGVTPLFMENGEVHYRDKWQRPTTKHRFRAEPYSHARAQYCAKYLTKDAIVWDFAHVTQDTIQVTEMLDGLVSRQYDSDSVGKDCKGNWDKKAARLRMTERRKAQELADGQRLLSISKLLNQSEYNYAQFSKLRMNPDGLDIAMTFNPKPGIKVYT